MAMLGALNEDCCQLVLGYLSVRDLVRAERVSRQWQQAVRRYIRGIRIRIECTSMVYDYTETRGRHCHILNLDPDADWFDKVTSKLGLSIVASFCFDEWSLLSLLEYCPNLEQLALIGITQDTLQLSEEVIHFKNLKQITFQDFMDIDDNCINNFLRNNDKLEELIIFGNEEMEGRCLSNLPTSLENLSLVFCKGLELKHLLTALHKLSNIKKLELIRLPPEILQNAHLILNEVPELEELALMFDEKIDLENDISEGFSNLAHLKCLDLSGNPNVTNSWLEVVRQNCPQLEELNVARCTVSARAVTSLCRAAGSTLKTLDVTSICSMDDFHVLTIIGSCPNLESLDVSNCGLSPGLTLAAQQLCAARTQPLRLKRHLCSSPNHFNNMLDILNEDCWRLVLSYVPVEDIARAERVSRQWQEYVLKYLRGIRIRIETYLFDYEETRSSACRILKLEPDLEDVSRHFEQVTNKFGSAIVASYCYYECTLQSLLRNCPNLEHLALIGKGHDDLELTEEAINIKKLKQISFKYFLDIDDDFIVKFLGSDTLEEFIIFGNKKVTGKCLFHLPTTLKSLCLLCCKSLEADNLIAAIQNLPRITQLALIQLSPKIAKKAHLVLNKVQELDKLVFCFDEQIEQNYDTAKSIGRLEHLKRLDLNEDVNVTDSWLKVIQEGQCQLQKFHISKTSVSGSAVVAFCQAQSSTLRDVSVAFNGSLDDSHVLAVIDSCPKLELLDVMECRLSAGFLSAAAQLCAQRAQPLHLFAEGTLLRRSKTRYPGLILYADDYEDFEEWYAPKVSELSD